VLICLFLSCCVCGGMLMSADSTARSLLLFGVAALHNELNRMLLPEGEVGPSAEFLSRLGLDALAKSPLRGICER